YMVDLSSKVNSYRGELQDLYSELAEATIEQVKIFINDHRSDKPHPQIMGFLYSLVESRMKVLSTQYLVYAFIAGAKALEKQTGIPIGFPWVAEKTALEAYNLRTFKRLLGDVDRNVSRLIGKTELRENPDELYDRIRGVFSILEYRTD